MVLPPDGEKLLQYAERILAQVNEVENMFKDGHPEKQRFSISVPKASYIAHAIAQLSKHISQGHKTEIIYKETNSQMAISNVLHADYKLSIIRYAAKHDAYFKAMFEEKGLVHKKCPDNKKLYRDFLIYKKDYQLTELDKMFIEDLTTAKNNYVK